MPPSLGRGRVTNNNNNNNWALRAKRLVAAWDALFWHRTIAIMPTVTLHNWMTLELSRSAMIYQCLNDDLTRMIWLNFSLVVFYATEKDRLVFYYVRSLMETIWTMSRKYHNWESNLHCGTQKLPFIRFLTLISNHWKRQHNETKRAECINISSKRKL